MKIEIEIPEEFEKDFKHDRFEECLTRLNADAHMTAGNYEKETAIMLIKALKNSKPAYDPDRVVAQLEEYREEMEQFKCGGMLSDMIEVVKAGGVE